MKKIKFIVAIVLTTIFSSCNNEEINETPKVDNQEVMRFASEKEMNAKIAEIEVFKKNQEEQILQKILLRNNLSAPALQDVKNVSKKEITDSDQPKILEDIKFYHQEKLKAIYAERAHFGFTSIQSIADEVNYSMFLDPNKAEKLKSDYEDLLVCSEFITKVKVDTYESLISNSNGEYFLNSIKNTIKVQNHENTLNRLTGLNTIKEGVLISNGSYSITYHVGVSTHKDDIGITFYGNFTQYGSFVNGALYPSWFYTNSGSKCTFQPYGLGTPSRTVDFIASSGDIVRNIVSQNTLTGNSQYNTINTNYTNQVSGTYVTVINGQFVSLIGYKNLNQ